MQSMPDVEYKWLLRTSGHFTKFSMAYPLKTRKVESVGEKLLLQFYLFGVPRTLQGDNREKIVAKLSRH